MARNLFPQGKSFEELNTRFNDVMANQPEEVKNPITAEKETGEASPKVNCRECNDEMDYRNGYFCSDSCEANFKFRAIRQPETIEEDPAVDWEDIKYGFIANKAPGNWKQWAISDGERHSKAKQKMIDEIAFQSKGRRHI